MAPRLEVRSCWKEFPGVQALRDVSIDVRPGEIHALLGENGAGKSTLGKVIGGVYQADAGDVLLDGNTLGRIDEHEATRLGIAIVHQEGSLVSQLSVAENVFAGHAPKLFLGRVDRKESARRTRALMADLGVDIAPEAPVYSLSTAQAQVVEIAKGLSHELRLLILDEPTASLTLTEAERLFGILHRLRDSGVAIIYISHRLAEIFQLCDRVTVLKDGAVTGTRDVAATSQDELIRLMVGRDVLFARGETVTPGEIVLQVEHLAVPPAVEDVSFNVRAGELVCLAGLVGSGRSDVCQAIFGVRGRSAGVVRLDGTEVHFSGPWDAVRAGVGMMPEDRKVAGLFLGHSVAQNIAATVLGKVSRNGVLSRQAMEDLARRYIDDLNISTPSTQQLMEKLSGGNQQKVLLAKWLAPEPRLLIVDEPTRGVDVGARAEIYRILGDLKAGGLAIVVVSSDLPEVLTLADRIVVMASGRTVGELDGATATEEDVLRLATKTMADPTAVAA
jgi:ribose transport system ATP-binding protein/rhamnose transport system ATP-binding protein